MTKSTQTKIVIQNEHECDDNVLNKQEFGFYLSNMRKHLGIGRAAFANLLGMSTRTYSNNEVGESLPDNWLYIKQRTALILKNKRLGRPLDYTEPQRNSELLDKVIKLHKLGKNTVQIGLDCLMDDRLVANLLTESGYDPIIYTYYDYK